MPRLDAQDILPVEARRSLGEAGNRTTMNICFACGAKGPGIVGVSSTRDRKGPFPRFGRERIR